MTFASARLVDGGRERGASRSEDRVASAAREKLNRGGRLPLVRLETQWHAHDLCLGAVGGRWERARVFRRKDGRSATSRRRRLPLVVSRGRGGTRPGKTKGDRNDRERRDCPKRTRPARNRGPFAGHTRCPSLLTECSGSLLSQDFLLASWPPSIIT